MYPFLMSGILNLSPILPINFLSEDELSFKGLDIGAVLLVISFSAKSFGGVVADEIDDLSPIVLVFLLFNFTSITSKF